MGGGTASAIENFSKYGPIHLTSIDWNNLYHRTALLSSLVKAVSILERDRMKKRSDSESPARFWWEFFGFTKFKTLTDKHGGSIYGVVFRNTNNYQNNPNSIVPPRYVIALRGTMGPFHFDDLKTNIRLPFETFHSGGRSLQAIQEIKTIVAEHGNTTVWIAGYSQGAGLALLAGKEMAMSGFPVEAYNFNPPISLLALEYSVKSDFLKGVFRFSRDFFKAGLAKALDLDEGQDGQQFKNLASWRPHLFVNQSDPICSEYIGYFKHGVSMAKLGLGKVSRLANGYSVRRMALEGEENVSSNSSRQHLHFLPSAIMMVNRKKWSDVLKNHGLPQWWDSMLPQSTIFDSY